MQYTLLLWHADHVNFSRLLNLLEKQLQQVHDARRPDYGLMLDIMYYVTHYSDALHHPKEDLVFARIKMRDASVGHTVDALTDQHARLRDEGETLVRALDDIVNGSILSRESVESTARAYISEFRAHMRVEETEMLPLAARLLTDDDWAGIDAAIASFDDPLFGPHVDERYRSLRDQINRQVQSTTTPER